MSSEGFSASELDQMPDRIAETFAGQTVLVSGGTGFMGKVLIEKLLRKCPDLKNIFLIVRPKKGKTPKQRLEELFHDALFEKLRNLKGGVEPLLEKMTLIAGDMTAPDLDISPADRQMIIEEVNLIVHAAATIRFDEELKKAVLLNVRGTKLMVEMAKECKNLKLFIHVSTAYCHLHEKLLEEKPYPPPADPHQIIKAVEWMDEETIAALTPKLLSKLPNSYAFTKALGEALVVEAIEQKLMPGMVLRPSIVIPIWQEPIPGWTDNINGPTGLLIGAGKGVIRTMYCKGNSYADYLPVDIFINGIMIAAWNYISYGDKESTVVNFTSSAEIKVTWSEMIEAGREIILNRVPLNGVAWYPGGSMKHSRLYHNICAFFFHWVPAVIVDILLFCLGYKPVLMRVQRRIQKGFEVFEYYTNNQWDFKSDIAQNTRKRLNPRERRDYKVDAVGTTTTTTYYNNNQWDFKSDIAQNVRKCFKEGSCVCNIRLGWYHPHRIPAANQTIPIERRDYKVDAFGLDISKYFEDCIRAARIFILKEYDDTLPAARRHMKVMWVVDVITRLLFWGLLLYWMSGWFSSLYTGIFGANEVVTAPNIMES